MLMGVAMVGVTVVGGARRRVGCSPFLHGVAPTEEVLMVARLLRKKRAISPKIRKQHCPKTPGTGIQHPSSNCGHSW